jgi:hypothetical protein
LSTISERFACIVVGRSRNRGWICEDCDCIYRCYRKRKCDNGGKRPCTRAAAAKDQVVPLTPILYISELFEWYEDDYAKEEGSVREFIKAYADDHVKEKMDATTRINYIDYDWSLNKPGNFPGFEEAFAELD